MEIEISHIAPTLTEHHFTNNQTISTPLGSIDQFKYLNNSESQATLDLQSLQDDNDSTDYETYMMAQKLQENIDSLKAKIELIGMAQNTTQT